MKYLKTENVEEKVVGETKYSVCSVYFRTCPKFQDF
jgi:hypothetical protein